MPSDTNERLAPLRAELERVLAARGIELDEHGRPLKRVSSTPRRDYLTPSRAIVMGNAILGWRHGMLGDYDQNGEVNIADLTPIGMHLGKTSASPDWDAACAADGDGNGEVNISDVTPIGGNFGAVCDGYVVEARYGQNGKWREFGHVPFSSAIPAGVFKDLGYTAVEGAGENDYRVAPVAATREFAWTVYALNHGAGEFVEPALCLVNGKPTLAFVDEANYILYYAYSSSAHPLKADDWTVVKADFQQTNTVRQPGMAEVGGLAAIAYISVSTSPSAAMFYCRPTTTAPQSRELAASDWISYQLEAADDHSAPPSIAERDGTPVMFWGGADTQLRMATTGAALPAASDWQIFNAYDSNTWPCSASLGFVSGRPVLAFTNTSFSITAGFCRALMAAPSGPADFVTYDFAPLDDMFYSDPSLAVAGNRPCLVYPSSDHATLLFRQALIPAPDLYDWNEYTLFASLDEVSMPWMGTLDGKPALTFLSGGKQFFYWAVQEQPAAVQAWHTQSVAEMDWILHGAFIVADGLPITAYSHYLGYLSGSEIIIAVAQEK